MQSGKSEFVRFNEITVFFSLCIFSFFPFQKTNFLRRLYCETEELEEGISLIGRGKGEDSESKEKKCSSQHWDGGQK